MENSTKHLLWKTVQIRKKYLKRTLFLSMLRSILRLSSTFPFNLMPLSNLQSLTILPKYHL